MEFWFSESRRVAAENIGPAQGNHLLGSIDGPGLYLLRSDNAGGKSSLGRLLQLMSDTDALRQHANITDGELSAYLELEPRRVTFSRSPAGAVRVEVTGGKAPEMEPLPAAIESLIHADHLSADNPEGRARHRLAALLSYAPIPTSPGHLNALLGCLGKLPEFDAAMRQTWDQLLSEAGKHAKRLRAEPLKTRAEIRDWVVAHPKRSGQLLSDHDLVTEMCNALGNCGEKAAEAQRRRVEKIKGRLEEAVEAASRQVGWTGAPDKLRTLLESTYDLAALTEARSKAREEQTRVETSAAGRRAAEERRERLIESRGARPDAEVNAAESAVESVELARDHELQLAEEELHTWYEGFSGSIRDAEHSPRWGSDVSAQGEIGKKITDRIAVLLRRRPENSPGMAEAQRLLAAAQEARLAWDRVGRELDEPIEGATDFEVETARTALSEAEGALTLAKAAQPYQVIAAELAAALDLARQVDDLAAAYRTAAKDSWSYLGQIITEALKLPWLQVDGLDLYLGYVGKQLNNSPELLAQAQAAAEVAAAALDTASPVSLPRFIMEKIREAPGITWRNIDDEERVSTGELHEACLAIFLDRLEPGALRWVPWHITAAFDPEKMQRFDRAVRERNAVLIGEEPRRQGDPEGIWLEKVANRYEGGEA